MTYPGGGSGNQQPGSQQQGGMPQGSMPQSGMQPQQTQQQQGFQPYQQQPPRGPGLPIKISTLVALGVTLLSLIEFFISFSDDANDTETPLRLLLLGGLLAALHAVPKMPKVLPFATLASVLGGLFYILHVVHVPDSVDTPGIMIAVLILGILQMLVAIAALLLDYEIIPIPTGGPKQPQYGQYQPYQAQQASYGAAGQPQPTQFGPPVSSTQQGQAGQPVQTPQQPTQYASQQGQFFTSQSQVGTQQGGGQQDPNSGQ